MKIQLTKDGSHTLISKEFGELYHSHNGSIQEAEHIFIQHGLVAKTANKIQVFEMGFGSGLNAILSFYFAKNTQTKITYTTIEAFPISTETAQQLNYNSFIQETNFEEDFEKLHRVAWNKDIKLADNFNFLKLNEKIENLTIDSLEKVDIIFYDAFAPAAQANLWEEEILAKMFDLLKTEGFLITYCAKGAFKRTLKHIGFQVEALPGPIGKREITRAWKRA